MRDFEKERTGMEMYLRKLSAASSHAVSKPANEPSRPPFRMLSAVPVLPRRNS